MEVYVSGKRLKLPAAFDQGGEAEIFQISPATALKMFKNSQHPDYKGDPRAQEIARLRLREKQQKLPHFPKTLPGQVIQPQAFATNKIGEIIGYTMRFLNNALVLMYYADRQFRNKGVSDEGVREIFLGLHDLVSSVHREQVVIGDFNDLNVLIAQDGFPYLVDADSFQYGQFYCCAFTNTFLDPSLRDFSKKDVALISPYSAHSDWYAFAIMLMRCLLFVGGPYDGIYRPKDVSKIRTPEARVKDRITLFHPEVKYPKPARPLDTLPDEFLHCFEEMFARDKRLIFPRKFIENLEWRVCAHCGREHARTSCPSCVTVVAPAAVVSTAIYHGQIIARRIFRTSGQILYATQQHNMLRWLYYENHSLRREGEELVFSAPLDRHMRMRINGSKTVIGKQNRLRVIDHGIVVAEHEVDTYRTLPVFDANSRYQYWLTAGKIYRNSILGDDYTEYVGEALSEQSLLWVGSEFGFGWYRAGSFNVGFVFDAERSGINDSVELPPLIGQLVDATCEFADELCWFFVSLIEGGKVVNHCIVIGRNGIVLTHVRAEQNEDSWLSQIRNTTAFDSMLFVPTDEGLVRISLENDRINEQKIFPDTQKFLHKGVRLVASKSGLFAVHQREIYELSIR